MQARCGLTEKMLAVLRDHFPKLLVILNTGYPIAMGFVDQYRVDAVVHCGAGGCYKHLIANGGEGARKRNDSILS